jgi:hypothetical protein
MPSVRTGGARTALLEGAQLQAVHACKPLHVLGPHEQLGAQESACTDTVSDQGPLFAACPLLRTAQSQGRTHRRRRRAT